MPPKTEKDDSAAKNLSRGDQLTFDQITALSNNMFERMLIMDDGNFRKLDPKKDTRSAFFEKSRIDELFAAHPGSDGLKIYFGVHDANILKLRHPNYDNKLMAMLVTTTGGVDNLTKTTPGAMTPMTGGGGTGTGSGMDNGKICPPDPEC